MPSYLPDVEGVRGQSFVGLAGMWAAKSGPMNIPNVLLTVMTVLVSATALAMKAEMNDEVIAFLKEQGAP